MRLPVKLVTILGALSTLMACGQSDRDFYTGPHSATATSAASTGVDTMGTSSSSAGGMASHSSGHETASATTSSTASAGGTTTASGTDSASTGTTETSTTGLVNDPECPEVAPEATSACLGMVGLSCTYGEITCVCSGITWNCAGGDSETTPGTAAGSLTTSMLGSIGSTTDGETTTTNGSESRFR